jgi:hypothetical protein
VAVERSPDGQLAFFVRGLAGDLWQRRQSAPNAAWEAQSSSMAGQLVSEPTLAQHADGRLAAFGVGSRHQLTHAGQSSPGSPHWSDWIEEEGPPIAGSIAVARNQDGRLELFARSVGLALIRKAQIEPNGPWSAWADLGGQWAGDPVAARLSDGRLALFVLGPHGQLWCRTQSRPGRWDDDSGGRHG